MKKPKWPKFTSEIYKDAGYSNEVVSRLEEWESEYPSVENVLCEYRYIQPDGELFSEHSLKIIFTLHNVECMLDRQRDLAYETEQMLELLINQIYKEQKESMNFHFDEDVF